MDVHKTLCPFYTIKKRPNVTAEVTKMRSLAAIGRHGSRKDFFQRGPTRAVSAALHTPNWGERCYRGPKFSPVATEGLLWA